MVGDRMAYHDRLVSWQVPENEFTAQADDTLRRLLSHTSGVNQDLNKGYDPGEAVITMLQVLDGVPPTYSLHDLVANKGRLFAVVRPLLLI